MPNDVRRGKLLLRQTSSNVADESYTSSSYEFEVFDLFPFCLVNLDTNVESQTDGSKGEPSVRDLSTMGTPTLALVEILRDTLGLVEILRDVLGLVEILRDIFSPPLEYTAVGSSTLVERHEMESGRNGRDWCASSIIPRIDSRASDDHAWGTVKNAQSLDNLTI
ncbi:hypothetical protein Tco_0868043 [Tanacetum coccineum]